MDKLTCCVLISSFLYSPVLTFIMLIMYLFNNTLDFNYKSLFLAWFCFFYWMFDFVNMMCVLFSSSVLLACGGLYWYDIDNKYLDTIPYVKHQTNKLQSAKNKYKTYITNKITNNTNITKTNLIYYEKCFRKYYTYVSYNFDKLCSVVYSILCKFRELTQDIPGCKNIYSIYDTIYVYIDCINLMKTTKPKKNVSFEKNMFNMMNTMTPEEKKQMNDMTAELMKNFNINDLFGGAQTFSKRVE